MDELIDLIHQLALKPNLPELVFNILRKFFRIYERVSEISTACQANAQEKRELLQNLIAHVKNEEYLSSLKYHSLTEIGTIIKKIMDAKSAVQLYKIGLACGDLVKFVFFWNFENNN